MKLVIACVTMCCCCAPAFAAPAIVATTFSSTPIQVPAENSSSASSLTTPPTPSALGKGGVLVGRARWTGLGRDFAALWTSDGQGFDLLARAINSGTSSSNFAESHAIGVNAQGQVALQYGKNIYIASRPSPIAQPNTWTNQLVYANGLDIDVIRYDWTGFNDNGEIVVADAAGGSYYFKQGTRVRLNTSTGTPVVPTGINNAGVIVGNNHYGSVIGGAAVFTSVQPPAGSDRIDFTDINESGLITGYTTTGSVNQPFTYTPAEGFTFLSMPDGFTSGRVSGINDSGDMVGFMTDAGGLHAAYWKDGLPYLLPDALDSTGTLVALRNAPLISNDGYVYAEASGARGFILTPIPEPSLSLAPLAILALLAGRRLRCKGV